MLQNYFMKTSKAFPDIVMVTFEVSQVFFPKPKECIKNNRPKLSEHLGQKRHIACIII